MKRKSGDGVAVTATQLSEQVEKDKALFEKLGVNLRRARRGELAAVWPKEFLPDAEEPELDLPPA